MVECQEYVELKRGYRSKRSSPNMYIPAHTNGAKPRKTCYDNRCPTYTGRKSQAVLLVSTYITDHLTSACTYAQVGQP